MSTTPTDNSTDSAPGVIALDKLTLQQLEQFIGSAVTKAVEEMRNFDASHACNRLAYNEWEAATVLGVKGHVLRDARLRGEIESTYVGGRIAYSRTHLINYLENQKG